MACVYGLFVGSVVYHELTFKILFEIMKNAIASTSMIMMIICCATVFGTVMTREMIPQKVCSLIMEVASTPLQFMILIMLLLDVYKRQGQSCRRC